MKMPHWLKHRWSPWEIPPPDDAGKHGYLAAAYDWRYYDVRSCHDCGRRQMRHI